MPKAKPKRSARRLELTRPPYGDARSLAITSHVKRRIRAPWGPSGGVDWRMASEPQLRDEPRASEFGAILRHWRRARRISQLDLASLAGLSTRHLSFLETGRCGPSRSTVLQLGRALALPRSETERLLIVAGYAGDWHRHAEDSDATRGQLAKVAHLLAAHDPFPAFITDPDWSVAWHNRGARALFERLRELAPGLRIDPVDLRLLLRVPDLGQVVRNLAALLEGVLAGLYELAPDPVCFGHGRSLLDCLPSPGRPGDAIERAARSRAWEHELRIGDRGAEFSLEMLSLPFAGGASGYALVLTQPADAASRAPAHDYFTGLLAAR
jgi:transcriptional regulator with XRE-family HTH domain